MNIPMKMPNEQAITPLNPISKLFIARAAYALLVVPPISINSIEGSQQNYMVNRFTVIPRQFPSQ